MSGQTPQHAFTVPKPPARSATLQCRKEAIDALRNMIPVSRDNAMRWVDPSFEQAAKEAYITIGSPSLQDMHTGWSIFSTMAAVIIL
jgi:hypothetical protein